MASQARPVESAGTLIAPPRGWMPLNVRELWGYRELLMELSRRVLLVRYKQTLLGASWVIIQPFLTMVVFSVIFGRLTKIPSDALPYPIFAYAAVLPWQFFSQSVNSAGNALVVNGDLVTKIYFPRAILVLSTIVAGLLDFFIAFVVVIGMMAYYGIVPGLAVLALPLFLLLAIGAALGVGLWLAPLNARYRDVRLALPFMMQLWMFATPVFYSSSLIPDRWRLLSSINPMMGVIDGFRWALLGSGRPPLEEIGISVAVVALVLVGGLLVLRRMEATLADVV